MLVQGNIAPDSPAKHKAVPDAAGLQARASAAAEKKRPCSCGRQSIAELAGDTTAVIFRPCRSAMTSGTRSREWVLRFERRRPFFVEPLMGWTGDDDPIGQVELRFPDLQSAAAYADREGISYRIADAEHDRSMASAAQDERASYVDAVEETLRSWLAMAWLQAQHGQAEMPWLPDLDRALINPAAVFRSPEDVLSHPLLATNIKRRILQQWAWDEYLIEVAADEAMVDSAPSRLAEVKSALAKLESWPAETIVTFRDRPLPAHEERV